MTPRSIVAREVERITGKALSKANEIFLSTIAAEHAVIKRMPNGSQFLATLWIIGDRATLDKLHREANADDAMFIEWYRANDRVKEAESKLKKAQERAAAANAAYNARLEEAKRIADSLKSA